MDLSKKNMRQPSRASQDPMYAAASITDDHNISALAKLMGKNEKTLAAKLNNDHEYDNHHLHFVEVIALTELTDDERILKAWATSRGKALINLPTSNLTDDELSDLLLSVQESVGVLSGAIRASRANGVISESAYAGVNKATLVSIELLLQLDAEIKAMVRDWGDSHI
ncbi:phage regulatory CII family protein [Rheinheimera sp. MMS21-TC3]|uniref:phage regulatory CII family protein n=1 Tax=Rheinheimera sp. MMS21-TC3 TaxID=3072790 RepID=UPI0028C45C4B|nr:phage regulatory CII family protein [Rheinheimera sp. MMS21-TC3]WNO60420.1 phage regulatory CII family protein [Rheinheimera sp. MMS21-TC3]